MTDLWILARTDKKATTKRGKHLGLKSGALDHGASQINTSESFRVKDIAIKKCFHSYLHAAAIK
ncbi:MAG TPA: hypothetical protein DCR17_14250 [Verrucomicrobiales bacterium]|nr:hypothetical protein [Verrucomicrobiales bacterium]HAW02180.1 hypothetical protein [Verrucomicrobiales bacterium]